MEPFSWKKLAIRSLILIPIAFLGLVIFPLLGGPPLYVFFNISGPTTGVSRALLAALRFDFQTYLYYHPLAIPLLFVFLFTIFHDLLPVSRKIANLIFITTGVIAFLFHLLRLFFLSGIQVFGYAFLTGFFIESIAFLS